MARHRRTTASFGDSVKMAGGLLQKSGYAARYVGSALKRFFSWLLLAVVLPLARQGRIGIANTIRRRIKKSRRHWGQTSRPYRFYVVGNLIMLIWFFLSAWLRNIEPLFPLLLLGAAMYLIGFVIWSKPIVKKLLASWWGKWAFTILHGFLLILAIVVARQIVAEAIALPPQYFDLTISFVALIAYVPVCIAALAVFMFLFFAAMLVVAAVTNFLPNLVVSLCRPVVGNAHWLNRFNAKYGMVATKAFYHAVGAMVVVFVLAASLDVFGLLEKHAHSGVRWLAYATDFQPAGRYPGTPCDGRIKLQDNGVVALAQIKDKDIDISLHNFDSNANFADNCLTGKGKQ